jgi:microcystin-dependent protein
MSNNDIGPSVPVGSVLVFAGNETTLQKLEGWFPCDGRELDNVTHRELFAAIGYANGGDGSTKFRVPDYRGYFLRGVSQGSGRDPDAATRTAPASLGNSGDNPGSIQPFATALPSKPFVFKIDHLPTSQRKANVGSLLENHVGKWNSNSTEITLKGGAKETRARNKYVYFIIKKSSKTEAGTDVVIPVGTIVPFAGTNTAGFGNQWLLCNGSQLDATQQKLLFGAIGIIHGGDGNPFYYLPDYRGWFLRGVSGATLNDPDASARFPPQGQLPSGQRGATGNNVGSGQSSDTAQARNKFKLKVSHLPASKMKVDKIAGNKNSKWEDLPVKLDGTSGGGDESRPINANVDWYIKAS